MKKIAIFLSLVVLLNFASCRNSFVDDKSENNDKIFEVWFNDREKNNDKLVGEAILDERIVKIPNLMGENYNDVLSNIENLGGTYSIVDDFGGTYKSSQDGINAYLSSSRFTPFDVDILPSTIPIILNIYKSAKIGDSCILIKNDYVYAFYGFTTYSAVKSVKALLETISSETFGVLNGVTTFAPCGKSEDGSEWDDSKVRLVLNYSKVEVQIIVDKHIYSNWEEYIPLYFLVTDNTVVNKSDSSSDLLKKQYDFFVSHKNFETTMNLVIREDYYDNGIFAAFFEDSFGNSKELCYEYIGTLYDEYVTSKGEFTVFDVYKVSYKSGYKIYYFVPFNEYTFSPTVYVFDEDSNGILVWYGE